MKTNKKIEKAVVSGYKKVEKGVVDGYKKIEDGVVNSYKKIEDKFVDIFLSSENDSEQENACENLQEQEKTWKGVL